MVSHVPPQLSTTTTTIKKPTPLRQILSQSATIVQLPENNYKNSSVSPLLLPAHSIDTHSTNIAQTSITSSNNNQNNNNNTQTITQIPIISPVQHPHPHPHIQQLPTQHVLPQYYPIPATQLLYNQYTVLSSTIAKHQSSQPPHSNPSYNPPASIIHPHNQHKYNTPAQSHSLYTPVTAQNILLQQYPPNSYLPIQPHQSTAQSLVPFNSRHLHSYESQLLYHADTVPAQPSCTGALLYQCCVCTDAFSKRFSLKRHMKKHSKSRPYRCDHAGCNLQFAERSTLSRHRRTHTGEKPFVCKYKNCTRIFADRTNVRRHLLTHLPSRQYNCVHNECNDKFTSYDKVQQHIIDVHNSVGLNQLHQQQQDDIDRLQLRNTSSDDQDDKQTISKKPCSSQISSTGTTTSPLATQSPNNEYTDQLETAGSNWSI